MESGIEINWKIFRLLNKFNWPHQIIMMGLKRWQLVVLLLIGSVLIVKCSHHHHESKHEEEEGHKGHEDHFHDESHKGDKGYHKKVNECVIGLCTQRSHISGLTETWQLVLDWPKNKILEILELYGLHWRIVRFLMIIEKTKKIIMILKAIFKIKHFPSERFTTLIFWGSHFFVILKVIAKFQLNPRSCVNFEKWKLANQ